MSMHDWPGNPCVIKPHVRNSLKCCLNGRVKTPVLCDETWFAQEATNCSGYKVLSPQVRCKLMSLHLHKQHLLSTHATQAQQGTYWSNCGLQPFGHAHKQFSLPCWSASARSSKSRACHWQWQQHVVFPITRTTWRGTDSCSACGWQFLTAQTLQPQQ